MFGVSEDGEITLLWTELCSPRNSYVDARTPSVTVYGDGPLRRWLRLHEVIRVGA